MPGAHVGPLGFERGRRLGQEARGRRLALPRRHRGRGLGLVVRRGSVGGPVGLHAAGEREGEKRGEL